MINYLALEGEGSITNHNRKRDKLSVGRRGEGTSRLRMGGR